MQDYFPDKNKKNQQKSRECLLFAGNDVYLPTENRE
jgi:hypothetical protein